MSLLPKVLTVIASASFVAGASIVAIPKPPSYTPRARPAPPVAHHLYRAGGPETIAHPPPNASGTGAIESSSAALRPAPTGSSREPSDAKAQAAVE